MIILYYYFYYYIYFFINEGDWISRIIIVATLVSITYIPQLRDIFEKLYIQYIGNLPIEIYEYTKPDRLSAYNFSIKIITVIGGWFIILLIIEQLISFILKIISYIIRLFLNKVKIR